MQGILTGHDLANWLSMLRSTDRRTFVIVEGPTDAQALDPHINEALAVTFPAHGKDKADEAINLLEARSFGRVLAVLDRDWVGMLDQPSAAANVVYTDDYDLDSTVFFSGSVLERVVTAHSDRDSRHAHLAQCGSSTVEAIVIRLAGPIGLVRYFSDRHGHGVNCQRFPVHAAMTASKDELDIPLLARITISRSGDAKVTAAVVERHVQTEMANRPALRDFSCGHDVATAVAALLRHWGTSMSPDAVEAAARAAFSCADLKTTALHQRVSAWSNAHAAPIWACT
ncbi:hypothetical protein [Patulibacter medicamentivorans]|uniref:hypothetical protein n=1 Tax=Patulibacter medicamentivorans TaxID=1097667 RepID=UPI00058F4779|nr:hypothetical protein [Patulibacter medicamentivorans]